jgi:hypothetical protein
LSRAVTAGSLDGAGTLGDTDGISDGDGATDGEGDGAGLLGTGAAEALAGIPEGRVWMV